MHRKIEARLKFATILLVFSGYLGLITTFSYGPDILWLPLVAMMLMPVGEWLDRRFPLYRWFTRVGIIAFIVIFFTILRRSTLLDAVIALVMFIHVYSLIHIKSVRNYVHIFLMSFFLLLAATSMTPRPDIAVVFVLFLVSLTWAMALLEMFTAMRKGTGKDPSQWRRGSGDLVPARQIRLFDMRFASLLTLTAAGVLAVAAAFFAVGPRTEAGVFGTTRSTDPVPTGLSSEVDLSISGFSVDTGAPVMRVQFPREPGGVFLGPMLWRVTALDAYTGGGWQHRGIVTPGYDTDEKRRLKCDSRLATLDGLDRPDGKWSEGGWPQVYYEIYLDRPPKTAVPLLQLVQQVMPGPENPAVQFRWDSANDFSVVLKSRGENGISLSAFSEIIQPTLTQLQSVPADYGRSMAPQDFAQLTYQDLLPKTLELVQRLTRDAPTAYEKIRAIEGYLNGPDFEYSRLVPILPAKHPIDTFVLEERKGHCQLFASALTLMVRSLGLPARVVSGYRGGNWDSGDLSYTITEDMAHVWTEVYFSGVGWVAFDPSPMDRESDAFSLNTISRAYARYILKVRMLWLRNVVAYQRESHEDSFRNVGARVWRFGGKTWEKLQSPDRRIALGGVVQASPVVIGFVGMACVFTWLVFRNRRRSGLSRAVLTDDQRRAVQLYKRITRRLRTLGVACEGRTAEELTVAAKSLSLNDGDVVPAGLALYNSVRFGRRSFSASELGAWNRRIAQTRVAVPAMERVTVS